MDVIIVVDMQVGLLSGPPKFDLEGVVDRINRLTDSVRAHSGSVVFVRHCGRAGDPFEPEKPGWAFLPALRRTQADLIVRKTLNDPFAGTDLNGTLQKIAPDRVLVAGWATDFCVDATVRSAVSNGYNVVAVADGHTVSDRPDLAARAVIRHHNRIWSNLITDRSIKVASTKELLET